MSEPLNFKMAFEQLAFRCNPVRLSQHPHLQHQLHLCSAPNLQHPTTQWGQATHPWFPPVAVLEPRELSSTNQVRDHYRSQVWVGIGSLIFRHTLILALCCDISSPPPQLAMASPGACGFSGSSVVACHIKGDMTPKLLHQLFPNSQQHQCGSNEKADTEDLKEHERVPLSSWKFDNFLGSSATRLLGKQHWPFRRMIAHWFSHFEIQLDPLDTLYQRSSAPLIRSASTATSPVACLLQPTWNGQWRSTCGKNRPNRWPNQSKKMLHFVIARIQLQQAVG